MCIAYVKIFLLHFGFFFSAFVASQKRQSENKNDSYQMGEYVMAGIASYIDTVKDASTSETSPVFKLTDLMAMYDEGMREFGFYSNSHTTRFKERLLDTCPYLEACGVGRGQPTLIVFRADMEIAVRKSTLRNYQAEGAEMSSVANIVRKDLFEHPQCNWQEMTTEKQSTSVPNSLKALVRMLLRGPRGFQGQEDSMEVDQAVLTISQLIAFNVVNKRKEGAGTDIFHHSRSRETPVPVYLALKIYNETRNKKLIQFTNKLGMTISYDRVKGIVRDKANEVCDMYHSDRAVCPPSLLKCIFTSAAADNIDHNLSSSTAVGSFHGTALSLVQHPLPGEDGKLLNALFHPKKNMRLW